MRIVFVRHGERVSRADDSPLTERECDMVRETGRRLAQHPVWPDLLHTG